MSSWTEATLLFIRDGDDILLIEKKRGHGKGLFNGPGGKVEESDESIKQAALREVEEETGLKPLKAEKRAILKFFFGDEKFQRVHVFVSREFEGELEECDEARPEWFNVGEIPYDNMWPDDEYWLPKVLEGKKISGTFYFDSDGDIIEDYAIDEVSF